MAPALESLRLKLRGEGGTRQRLTHPLRRRIGGFHYATVRNPEDQARIGTTVVVKLGAIKNLQSGRDVAETLPIDFPNHIGLSRGPAGQPPLPDPLDIEFGITGRHVDDRRKEAGIFSPARLFRGDGPAAEGGLDGEADPGANVLLHKSLTFFLSEPANLRRNTLIGTVQVSASLIHIEGVNAKILDSEANRLAAAGRTGNRGHGGLSRQGGL